MTDIPTVTEAEVLQVLVVFVVPVLIDIIRVGTYQIASRFKLYELADLTAGSRFGVFTTIAASAVVALVYGALFGYLDAATLGENTLKLIGISQVVYKLYYEKSGARVKLTQIIDLIGPKSNEVDGPNTVG